MKMLVNNTNKNIVIKCYNEQMFNSIKKSLTEKFTENPMLKKIVKVIEVD